MQHTDWPTPCRSSVFVILQRCVIFVLFTIDRWRGSNRFERYLIFWMPIMTMTSMSKTLWLFSLKTMMHFRYVRKFTNLDCACLSPILRCVGSRNWQKLRGLKLLYEGETLVSLPVHLSLPHLSTIFHRCIRQRERRLTWRKSWRSAAEF